MMQHALLLILMAAMPAAPPTAEQYYKNAIEATRSVAQPEFATYDVHVHVNGMGFALDREPDGRASMNLGWARNMKPDASFAAAYRKSDDLTAVQTPQGWATTHSPFFDPTWKGVDDWIRYGLNDPPVIDPRASSVPSAVPSGLSVIGAVRAMGVAFYDVGDGGASTCANGNAAHRVHLIA